MKEKKSLRDSHAELALEADGWDPENFTFGSDKAQPWKCELGHKWVAKISDRASGKGRCPFCIGKKVLVGFNDLATLYPELAIQAFGWDPTEVTPSSNKILKWKCSEGHEWEARPADRKGNSSASCPICIGKKLLSGFNDLATTHPELSLEADGWDPSKFQAGSKRDLAWKCSAGHQWVARLSSRALQGNGCPKCRTKRTNALVQKPRRAPSQTLSQTHPELSLEADGWDPSEVTAGSNKKKDWKCSAGHHWQAVVYSRAKGRGCPVCAGKKVAVGENDLSTLAPSLTQEADGWDPSEFSLSSNKKMKWRCSLGHSWVAQIASRAAGRGCPICSGNEILIGFNDLATTHPDIALEALGWDPSSLTAGSEAKRKWSCPNGHEYISAVKERTGGHGCPSCSVTGFDQTKDGWFYLLEHPSWELMQLGITNVPERRIAKHKKLGWVLIDLKGPMNGLSTRELETRSLRFLGKLGAQTDLKNVAGKFDGYSESWFKSKFSVTSIDQLIKRIDADE